MPGGRPARDRGPRDRRSSVARARSRRLSADQSPAPLRGGGPLAGYDASAWFEFGVAVVGAAAALSGLLFVAMSINIERIATLSAVPTMAAVSLMLFVLPLLVGLFSPHP